MAQEVYSRGTINYLKVAQGLAYAGTTLEAYTRTGLEKVHQSIYRRLAYDPPCQERCSEQYGRNFGRWCMTCQQWRRHFENYYRDKGRYQHINWKETQSWSWPDGPHCIAEVFLAQGWAKNVDRIDFNDLSTALSLWNNCMVYDIQPNTLKKLREVRNSFFAHNSKLEVSDDKMKTIFMVLGVFFRDDDLKDFVDENQCLHELDRIKQKNGMGFDDVLRKLDIQSAKLDDAVVYFRNQIQKERDAFLNRYNKTKLLLSVLFLLVVFTYYFLLSLYTYRQNSKPETDHSDIRPQRCFTERYSVPFTPEMQLEGYLSHNKNFTGRQWLVNELESRLFDPDFATSGVIVTADMGYGKSAFVTQLICANESQIAYAIRDKVIAYHLCKFDVLSSKNPALFIRRLVGMIANQIPAFGSAVSMQPSTSIIFDKQLCEQDPNGCFDQGFLFPIRNVENKYARRKLIIIDALDECADSFEGKNRIAELLRHRARDLPKWLALLITSRNMSNMLPSKDLQHVHLAASDPRNMKDIKGYIEGTMASASLVSKLKQFFTVTSNDDLFEKLVESSGGNFLFLRHAFDYWHSTNGSLKVDDVPSSLDRIYELNFERIFGTSATDFQHAKMILEIICASFHRLTINELSDIIAARNSTPISSLFIRKALNQLSMFVKNENDILMFTHISIRSWLLSEDNTRFPISVQNGAAFLSDYLLGKLQIESKSFNFTQLVLQVSRTNDRGIEEKFISMTQNKTKEITKSNTLHSIVNTVDSPKAINLIARHYKNIDQRNEKNLTASCIATIRGHLKALKRLVELGANINITIETNFPHMFLFSLTEVVIDYYKVYHFPGYKLLHLASQFGHVSLVEYILSKQKSQIKSENYLGHLPFHVACEFGKTGVLEYFIYQENMISDLPCLYFAAKNQHESVVTLLSRLDVSHSRDSRCVSESEASEIVKTIRYLNESEDTVITSENFVRPLDIWWKLRQDSPLHVSVRNGNFEISKVIASLMPVFLNCTDAGGLTPFLTSISHQIIDIYKLLMSDRFSDICNGSSVLMQRLSKTFNSTQITCDKGMRLTHFLALYGNKEMIEYANLTLGDVHERATSEMISPLHLAACSGNLNFLLKASQLGADFKINSKNGSTPFHSAVSCRCYIALYVFGKLPDVRDKLDMSLGLYLVKEPKEASLNSSADDERDVMDMHILQLFMNSSEGFLTSRDNMGRNIFHYALRNGHFHLVEHILYLRPNLSCLLLLQEDKQGNTPIVHALNGLNISQKALDVYMIPSKCFYIDLFRIQECFDATNLKDLMSPPELSLLKVMFFNKDRQVKSIFAKHFGKIMLYSEMYLVPYYLLSLAEENQEEILKDEIVYAVERDPKPHNILSLILIRPKLLVHCDRRYGVPPLHLLSKYMDKIMMTLSRGYSDRLLTEMFTTKGRQRVLLKCLDRKNVTLIERAVENKALIFVDRLICLFKQQLLSSSVDYNKLLRDLIYLNLNTKSHRDEIDRRQSVRERIVIKSLRDIEKESTVSAAAEIQTELHILQKIVFTNFEQHDNMEFLISRNMTFPNLTAYGLDTIQNIFNVDTYLQYEDLFWRRKDELIIHILDNFSNRIDFNIFCSERVMFSLVHLVAATNMHQTMSVLSRKAPRSVLKCANKHGVSPLYLAKVFQANETIKMMEKKIKLTLPNAHFEETLIFKLLSNFKGSFTQLSLSGIQIHKIPFTLIYPHKLISYIKLFNLVIRTNNNYKHIYTKHYPLLRTSDFKFLLSMLVTTRTILMESKKRELSRCYKFKKLLNVYQKLLSVSLGMNPSQVPKHLGVYKEIWENCALFINCDKCSVMRTRLNLILKVHIFTKRLLSFTIKRVHNLLFNLTIKDIKLSMNLDALSLFRKEIYFSKKKMKGKAFLGDETPRPEHFFLYSYIDVLKGVYVKMTYKKMMF